MYRAALADRGLLRDARGDVAAARQPAKSDAEPVSSNIRAAAGIDRRILFAAAPGCLAPGMSRAAIGALLRAPAINKAAPQRD